MSDQHPLTETAGAEIYGKDEEGHTLYAWRNPERAWVVRAMEAAFDAGREHERAQARPAEVTDEMRRAAASAYEDMAQVTRPENHEKCLNAALEAAIAIAPPAEEVDLPTEFGASIRDVKVHGGEVNIGHKISVCGGTAWVDDQGGLIPANYLTAFTLPDGTRARRDGEHEDGTPRFVKVEDGQ